MKRWGLHRIFYLCLLATITGGMATVAWAAKTDDLSSTPRDGLNTEAGVLLGQANEVLGPGSTGTAVKDLQAMLVLMGYYSGAVDGAYEQMTAEAVRQFQTDAGLIADGIVGPLTWRRLLPTPTTLVEPQNLDNGVSPSEGSSSPGEVLPDNDAISQTAGDLPILQLDDTGVDVSRLQTRLADLNFYTGPVDGVFGLQTEQAVQEFQRRAGLVIDGIVGPTTWLELFE